MSVFLERLRIGEISELRGALLDVKDGYCSLPELRIALLGGLYEIIGQFEDNIFREIAKYIENLEDGRDVIIEPEIFGGSPVYYSDTLGNILIPAEKKKCER